MKLPLVAPVLALIAWTLLLEVVLYATRLPAMKAAGLDPARLKRKTDLDGLPLHAQQIADNFNHLHEQPMVFYVLALCAMFAGADAMLIGLAWVYVGLRVTHSLIQCTFNFVPLRFAVFVLSSLVLAVMTGIEALTLF